MAAAAIEAHLAAYPASASVPLAVRRALLRWQLASVPTLAAIAAHRHRAATAVMRLGSLLGTEDTYALVVCVLAWLIDARLARLLTLVLAVGFGAVNAAKDALRLPRPQRRRLDPLEVLHEWSVIVFASVDDGVVVSLTHHHRRRLSHQSSSMSSSSSIWSPHCTNMVAFAFFRPHWRASVAGVCRVIMLAWLS
jgi:hypothetical protein